jgi:hypothetical protein
MNLMQKYNKWRRDRWVGKVVTLGKRLDDLYVTRRGVDSAVWPDDAAYLDSLISIAESQRDRLLTKLKETA